MSLSLKIQMLLNGNRAFKVYLFHKDKRITQHIVFPKNGKFTLKGNGYIINSNRIFFERKLPASVYSVSTAEPINPLDIDEKSELSSLDFYNAIEANVVQEIIRSTGEVDKTLLMAIILVGLLSFVGIIYAVMHIQGLIEAQNLLIQEIINKGGSGGLPPLN